MPLTLTGPPRFVFPCRVKGAVAAGLLIASLAGNAQAQVAAPPDSAPTVSPAAGAAPPAAPLPASPVKSDPADKKPQPLVVEGGRPTMPPSTALRRPDLFAPIPLYRNRNNLFFAGAADVRYKTQTTNNDANTTVGSYIAASRFTADYVRANPVTGEERGGARVQILLENNRRGTQLNKVRASELYAYYRFQFPGVSANVRVGQFVLPFGLLAVYDTPLQPIQPLYEKSLGLRVDTGVMLEGDYGLYHYAGSITNGSGPNRLVNDTNRNKVIAFRLERTVESRIGRFQVGGSILSGRLPVTNFATELPPSGVSGARDYIDKTRFAGDGEYFLGKLVARGEVVFGGDGQNPVYGYFAEGDYRIHRRVGAVAEIKRWNFPVRPQTATTLGAGLNFDIGGGLTLRTLYEFERDVPQAAGARADVQRRITVQTRLSF